MQRNQLLTVTLFGAFALLWMVAGCGHVKERPEPAREAVFYSVPLSCSIAPGQICSNKARLVVLDVSQRVPEGRTLMRPDGRVIALEVEAGRLEAGQSMVEEVLRERKLEAMRLTGEAEAAAREALRTGPEWYDAAALTRKTESGSKWFARKLVARLASRHELPPEVAEKLSNEFAAILLKSLLAESFSRRAERAELLEVARPHLAEEMLATLGWAYDAGLDTRLPEDPTE